MKNSRVKIVSLLTVATLLAVVVEYVSIARSADDFLQQLGLTSQSARDYVNTSVLRGYFSYPSGPKIKQVPLDRRAVMVGEIGAFAKAYTQSEEFRKKYAEYRNSLKPRAPEAPKPAAQQKAEYRATLEKGIAEGEKNLKSAPASIQDTLKQVIEMQKKQLAALDDPKNPMFSKDMDAMQQQGYQTQMEEYKKRLALWEKENPPTPNLLVQKGLRKFLDTSKDVDFSAALNSGSYGKKVFANPDYERKPSEWKLCYRAGKETVQAARAFAQQWLEELSKQP